MDLRKRSGSQDVPSHMNSISLKSRPYIAPFNYIEPSKNPCHLHQIPSAVLSIPALFLREGGIDFSPRMLRSSKRSSRRGNSIKNI